MALELALGRRPQWKPRRKRGVAVVELFPPNHGTLRGILGLERVERLRSFHRLRQRTSLGDPVGWARCGYRCPLFVVLAHEEPQIVAEEAELLPSLVQFRVEPS